MYGNAVPLVEQLALKYIFHIVYQCQNEFWIKYKANFNNTSTHPFGFSFYCDQNRISDFNFILPLPSIDFRLSSTNLIYDSQWNQAWWKKIHKLRLVEDVAMIKMEVK